MSLPPVFAASALYDNLLQGALRQFFGRATFETEPIPSLSSDGRLAIEPTNDPSVLSIRWFGTRHVLHVPARRPFTAHEVRLARAIGSVLAQRRHTHHVYVEPVIQIVAKTSRRDVGFQITMRGGNHARVDFDAALGAESRHVSLLENAQELRLHRGRQLADFIQ